MTGSKISLGDFQTPERVADAACAALQRKGIHPQVLVEPSCGEGHLVAAALKHFPTIREAYCIDIQPGHEPAFWRNVSPWSKQAHVEFVVADAFEHAFPVHEFTGHDVLILGNPPWVTNSRQSRLGSSNVPRKSNIKHVRGIEAMTGKGTFDIAEALATRVARDLAGPSTWMGIICKTSVVKNLVRDAALLGLRLSGMEMHAFDAKKEFGVSVAGAFFIARSGAGEEMECTVHDLIEQSPRYPPFGWHAGKFVSDIPSYKAVAHLDGKSPCTWRQGIKHDAARVMLLHDSGNGMFVNGNGETVSLEPDVLFPFIKGSRLRGDLVTASDTFAIMTQTCLADDTAGLESRAPGAWRYLVDHAPALDGRKSAIYKNRPRFCLFGVGDYAFKPFKVAIASFYKQPRFSLISPIHGKPAMLDDTCYYVSFDDLPQATCMLAALGSPLARAFLAAISFRDGKRIYSKEILSRLDVIPLLEHPDLASWVAGLSTSIAAAGMRAPSQRSIDTARQALLARWREKAMPRP